MTRITNLVEDAPGGVDVALLWGGSTQVGFWSLESTSATPYRSVDVTELGAAVVQVLDVPAPNQHLKVLTNSTQGFFVLNLAKRESLPLRVPDSDAIIRVALDGERIWVTSNYPGESFSMMRLSDFHPEELFSDPGTNQVFDIERADGGRAAVVLHSSDGYSSSTGGSATVFDAKSPNSAETAYYSQLFLEGVK
jgi:hypothetical protein